jgi:hypothetical protein
MARQRGLSEDTVLKHLERLIQAGERLELDHLLPEPPRLARIEAAFHETGSHLLAPVRDVLGPEYTYREIRLVLLYRRQREEHSNLGAFA